MQNISRLCYPRSFEKQAPRQTMLKNFVRGRHLCKGSGERPGEAGRAVRIQWSPYLLRRRAGRRKIGWWHLRLQSKVELRPMRSP